MNINRLTNLAKDIKPLKKDGHHFVVAFAVRQGRLLETGTNSYITTDTINKNYKNEDGSITAFRHAESDLIKKLRYVNKEKISVYILRLAYSGVRLAKPCNNCTRLLNQSGFKSIWFSNNRGQFEKL